MKGIFYFLLGLALMVVGLVLLLSNVNVGSVGFYRVGSVNTGAILVILFVVLVVAGVATAKGIFGVFAGIDLILLLVSVLMGTQFRLKQMSVFDLLLMGGTFAVGFGLTLRALLGLKNNKDKNNE